LQRDVFNAVVAQGNEPAKETPPLSSTMYMAIFQMN